MIPALLARQLREGVHEYLRTTFSSATPAFKPMLDALLLTPDALFRGPYVTLA